MIKDWVSLTDRQASQARNLSKRTYINKEMVIDAHFRSKGPATPLSLRVEVVVDSAMVCYHCHTIMRRLIGLWSFLYYYRCSTSCHS